MGDDCYLRLTPFIELIETDGLQVSTSSSNSAKNKRYVKVFAGSFKSWDEEAKMLTKFMRTRRLTGLCSQSFCEADKVLKSIDGAFCSSLSCKAMQRMKANFLPVSWTSLRRDRETMVSIPERAPLHRACSVSIVGTSNFARDGHAGLPSQKEGSHTTSSWARRSSAASWTWGRCFTMEQISCTRAPQRGAAEASQGAGRGDQAQEAGLGARLMP